jgi:valyl-tRNA synthetase
VLALAADVLGQVRKAKSAAKLSMRAQAARVVVRAPEPDLVSASGADLLAAGNIADLAVSYAPELSTEVTLAQSVAP